MDDIACYTPNGEDRNRQFGKKNLEAYSPCKTDANYSMCCAVADTCLGNGLCKNGDLIWRESCTDRTWQAPECVKLFLNGTGYGPEPIEYTDGRILADVTVTECDNGTFCYGHNNRACCQQAQGISINASSTPSLTATNPGTTTTSGTTTNPVTTTTPGTATTPGSTTTPGTLSTMVPAVPSGSGGLSAGAKAGIGAGVGGAILIAAIVAAYWYFRRKKQRSPNRQPVMAEQAHDRELPASQHQSSELLTVGNGMDYYGPIRPSELESPRPSVTDRNIKSSTTAAAEMG